MVMVACRPNHIELQGNIAAIVGGDRIKITDGSKGLCKIKGLSEETNVEEVREAIETNLGRKGA